MMSSQGLSTSDVVAFVAIGLGLHGNDQHSAIMYRDLEDKPKFLDFNLAGMRAGDASDLGLDQFRWFVPAFDEADLRIVSNFCVDLAQRKDRCRFRFSFEFDAETLLVKVGDAVRIEGKSRGFTCASFVLGVFQSWGCRLLDLNTWGEKPDSPEFRAKAIYYLKKNHKKWNVPSQDVEDLILEDSSIVKPFRYEPCEVAGACVIGGHPTSWKLASPAGQAAIQEVKRLTVKQ